jgi:catechol 2,3-dioxygenase-like lactoylglutathione lyase family enzyme
LTGSAADGWFRWTCWIEPPTPGTIAVVCFCCGLRFTIFKGGITMGIDSVSALLLISDDAEGLARFYRDKLELPIEPELHDDVPPHFGCSLGEIHFAIHPSAGWPGVPASDAQSPVIAFNSPDVHALHRRLVAAGVEVTDPLDHGFGVVMSLRDPDGNNIEVITPNG